MSYSLNLKGKFKVETELARDVAALLKESEIEYERPKKSIFELDDEMVLEENELNQILEEMEHIFEFLVEDLEQSLFVYIHELDPLDREIVINTNHLDLMTQNDIKSHIIFLDKDLLKNTKNLIDQINSSKKDILNMLDEKGYTNKWYNIDELSDPFILPSNFRIKIKGGNKGIYISALLDDDLSCENYKELFKIKENKELIEKFQAGYLGIRISTRAYYNELDEKIALEVAQFLMTKLNGFHMVSI